MPYLKTIIQRFDNDEGDALKRSIDVLDMIEYSISYPSCTTITKEERSQVERRTKQLLPELKEDPILAGRIEKWWTNSRNYECLARHVDTHCCDHLSSLHYHAEIIGIRRTRDRLLKLMRGEKSSLDDHGLFGTIYHHSDFAINHSIGQRLH